MKKNANKPFFQRLFIVTFILWSLPTPIAASIGSLDTSFDSDGKVTTDIAGGSYDQGYSVAVQSDGKIVVAGYSFNNANYDFAVVRYNTDGSLDTSFDSDGKVTTDIGGLDDLGTSAAIQSDGKIVLAGHSYGTDNDFAVVRYNTDGSLDTSFDSAGTVTTDIGSGSFDQCFSAAIQSDGKIVLAGLSYRTKNDFAVVRYNSDGSLDTSFDVDGIVTTSLGDSSDVGQSVSVQSDGKILVAGYSQNDANNDFAVVRYNTDGSLDTSFDTDGIVTTNIGSGDDVGSSTAIQSDGKILVAGHSNNDFAVVRYNTDGSLDTTFDSDGIVTTAIGNGSDLGYSVSVQSDGKIIVAGYSHSGANNDFAVVRYNTDGSLDNSFDTDGIVTTNIGSGEDIGSSAAIQSDGKILVAGHSFNGLSTDFAIVRYIGAAVCGDGLAETEVEACDDGNDSNQDACLTTCVLATCGDGHVELGVEQCDNGNGNSDMTPDACRMNCTNDRCGDGVIDSGEECDTGKGATDSCPNGGSCVEAGSENECACQAAAPSDETTPTEETPPSEEPAPIDEPAPSEVTDSGNPGAGPGGCQLMKPDASVKDYFLLNLFGLSSLGLLVFRAGVGRRRVDQPHGHPHVREMAY